MALQYQNIEEPSFGRGIDARSAENQIRDGFVRDLVNSDIVEGRVRKRKGFANYAGNLPVRVTAVRQVGSPINKTGFILDRSIDLSDVDITPLLVYGKYSSSIANDTALYYEQWETSIKKAFAVTDTTLTTGTGTSSATVNVVSTSNFNTAGTFLYSGATYSYTGKTLTSFTGVSPVITYSAGEVISEQTTITVPVSEHNIDSPYIYTGTVLYSPGPEEEVITVDETEVSNSTYDINLSYFNYTGFPEEVYVYYKDGRTILGETAVITAVLPNPGPPTTITIPATGLGGHNLSLGNIIYQLYENVGSGLVRRIPSSAFLDKNTNELTITPGTPGNYVVLLFSAPVSQSVTLSPSLFTAGGEENYRLTLSNVTSRYIFSSVYHDSTGEEILPDSVIYNSDNETVTFAFAKASYEANPGALRIYYDYGAVRANEITVTGPNVNAYYTDPQLTIYGLSHGNVYDASNPDEILIPSIYGQGKDNLRRGWANHVDSYRSPETTHMVAGLGGNLFAALSPTDPYFPSALLGATPTYYPKLSSKTIASNQVIGPAFWDTDDVPNLTRAVLKFQGGGTNWATVTSVQHITDNTVRYTLSVPGAVVVGGTLSNVISVTPDLEDYISVKGMSHSRHNGNFKITARSLVGDVLTLDVVNPRIKNSDYDDTGCSGLGGIFTDRVSLSAASPFEHEDILLSPAWTSATELSVQSSSSSTITVSQVYGKITLSPGVSIAGRRTSATIPLRNLSTDITTSLNIVVGDTVYLSGVNRPLQVVGVDTANNAITVDEALVWEDNISLPTPIGVSQRWIPAETPVPSSVDPDYALIPKTTVQHLSSNPYDNQPFLRSAMVQNNLYLTNGNDEVYKYDGQHFYRAGLIPWQPGLFLAVENVATGGIPLSGSGAQVVAALEGAQLRLATGPAAYFQAGDVVRFTNGEGINQLLTIKAINTVTSSTDKLFSFEETLDFTALGTTPRLTLVYQARYYFRLNVKDENGVTVSSAVTGALDFVATISPESGKQLKVLLRLVGLPPWDRYDFRNKNIELEVYRTLWSRGSLGEVPTFYRIQSIGLTYENNSGYIDVEDVYSNQTLTDSQQDFLIGALSAEGPPADWDEPARAKYVTTAGNRLVLANVTDWPTLTVTYLGAGLTPFASFAGQKFLYRRDSSESALLTQTNMLDRVTYELVPSSAAKTIYPVPGTSGHFKFSATTALPATLAAKDWVYLYHSTVSSGKTRTIAFINNSLEFILTAVNSLPNVGDIVYFDDLTTYAPTHSGGVPLDLTRGYFVSAVDSALTTTVANTVSATATLPVASVAGFPPTGTHFITVNGQVHSYNGVSTSPQPQLLNVTPAISANSNDIVLLSPGVSISLTYLGASLAFDNITTTTSGTGTAATTVNVASTTNFPTQGQFTIGGGTVVYTYTGKTATSFTSVSPAVSSYTAGQSITFFTSFGSVNWDGSELDYAGWYQVADVTAGVVTIHSPNLNWSTIPKQFPDRALFATNLEDVPVLTGVDGNMGMFNGNGPLPWQVVLRRLGMAINASMRVTDTTLAGQTTFVPWLIARSEGDTDGQFIVKQPRAEVATFSLTVSGTVPAPTYINGSLNTGALVKAVTTRYPSRLLVSYDNYPEIFDNPWTVNTDSSDSAIDVNSADGQEITGVIPFFGESAFGAALQSGVLVVFKQNSIYLVDLSAKAAGQNPVQRLETQGLGCTAPYSIASTKDGIAFANDSGVYVLRRNQRIEYLGRYIERLWQQSVDKSALNLVQGHHYGVGRQYKLSVPLASESNDGHAQNSEVYVYNHTGETADEPGGWGRYTNHAATGWANLFQDAFYSTCNGTVKRIRNVGDTSDYRDDDIAIESILEARATAYGNTGIRKVVASVTVHYRSGGNSNNTSVYMSPDLYQEYDLSSAFRILAKPSLVDGLGTVAGQDVVSIMHSFPKRRCIYMSVKIVNNGKDENVELAGFAYSVAGLSGAGVKQAGETD